MESSLPSRPPPSSSPIDPSPQPSITRPYKVSPPASPSALKPSALLQRRSRAKQGLYPVDAPAAGSTSADADGIDPSPTPPSPEVEQKKQQPPPPPSAVDRKIPSAYEILQVLPSASQQEIKSSFLALARLHHPDKAPPERKEASALLFLQIHSAYDTLRDPQSRARHDRDLFLQTSSKVFASTNVRKPTYCSPSPRIFASHSFTPRTTATAYTTPQSPSLYTPRSSGAATPSFTPRTPYSGKTWETDQYS